MEWIVLSEYLWILLILVVLEGLLAADNALVIAVLVKHLPEKERRRALFYGLAGAFLFRFLSLFTISYLVHIWQLQAIGALYLLFIAVHHVIRKFIHKKREKEVSKELKPTGFWMTVLKVELTDIVFAIDSILAAVAMAVALPQTSFPKIGGMDGGQFIVIFLGGFFGLLLMRFAASFFSRILLDRPELETVAFLVVGWVGIKLAVFTLSHEAIALLPADFPSSIIWKAMFFGVLVTIGVVGWFVSGKKEQSQIKREYS